MAPRSAAMWMPSTVPIGPDGIRPDVEPRSYRRTDDARPPEWNSERGKPDQGGRDDVRTAATALGRGVRRLLRGHQYLRRADAVRRTRRRLRGATPRRLPRSPQRARVRRGGGAG